MNKRIKWSLQIWDINKLKPYDKNPRVITEEGLKHLKNSFDEIGYAQPININVDGTILSGHARWQQLKKEGHTLIDVYVPDRKLTPKQEEAVIIRMNKNIAGNWDFDILANEFDIGDLKEWGFNDDDFPEIDLDAPVEGKIDDDEVPDVDEEKDPFTKKGDIYLLGAYYECEGCKKSYTLEEGESMAMECSCG